jgi:hypothetical protein
MERVLRQLGCFGLTLLAILFALGVTETLKNVGSLERTLGLSAAVLASAAIAWLRERWIGRRGDQRPVAPPAPAFRAPPGPDPRQAILASRRQAILFRQIVPPSHDRRHLSFFGGSPIAPREFEWPDAPDGSGESKPISFLMQIDCGAIPAEGRLGLMPDDGALYVFLEGGANAFRVLYHPAPTDDWTEVAPPETLAPVYSSRSAWRWPQSDADWPRLWPKWPFDPVLIQGGPLPTDPEAVAETYAWSGTIEPSSAIRAIPGAIVPLQSFRVTGRGADGVRPRPFSTFPHDWRAIRITTGLIAARMMRDATAARQRRFQNMSDAEFAAMSEAASSELRHWEERASAAPASDAVPPDERDRFWAWMTEREWMTWHVITDAATLSVEASLADSPDASRRIPADAVERIRHRHALAVETESGLHVNTPDRMLAAPVDVQGNIEDRVREFLLLLELSSDDGLAHYFGEGVLQFWIRPADLAARRFDRVEFSADAY